MRQRLDMVVTGQAATCRFLPVLARRQESRLFTVRPGQHQSIHAFVTNPDFTAVERQLIQLPVLGLSSLCSRPNWKPIPPSPAKVAGRFEVTARMERLDLLGHLLLVRQEGFRDKGGGCKHRYRSRTELPS